MTALKIILALIAAALIVIPEPVSTAGGTMLGIAVIAGMAGVGGIL